jgi:1-aminocyclopropane-1-carboxylate deaminase/D-cysteine desulfhydrase-like pyridoxal-dependent ACC family enzyme
VNRFPLGVWPTPLHPVPRLSEALDCPPIFVKRDDLSGFVLAGNKARPLEFLVADALAAGADTLVTGGRTSSNFGAAAAAAAAAAGLACHLVLASDASSLVPLALSFGAVVSSTSRVGSGIDDEITAFSRTFRAAYAIPRGGSTPVGAQGFRAAAHELDLQLRSQGVEPAAVVCAVGSGGSYAGLLLGAAELGWPWPVLGASVSRPLAEMHSQVASLAPGAVLYDCLAPGHGLIDDTHRELITTAACTAGLLLDPTYTAKALQLAVAVARRAQKPVVFWHTGGTPAALSTFMERTS